MNTGYVLKGLLPTAFFCISSSIAQAAAPEPSTYLFDAPSAAAAVDGPTRLDVSNWAQLNEDDTTHRFRGSPALVNDKIVAVLAKDQLDVYSRQVEGLKLCARLQPVCEGHAGLKRKSLVIKENSRASVSIEVGFVAPSKKPCHITYELNAGQPFVKTIASPGVETLRVEAPCRYAVLPDFFGDDILVDASTIPGSKAELPGENFLLHFIPGGDAIVLTVSESRDQDIAISLSPGSAKGIAYSDIAFGPKPRIWVAVLAEKGIWRERIIKSDEAGKVLPLDWQMPFPALWRVDWTKADKLTESWEMLLQDPAGKYVMQDWLGHKEAEGQNFGNEFGPRDWNKPGRVRWNPVLGAFKFPCWTDNDRQGYLQPLEPPKKANNDWPRFTGPAVVYPLDRVQAAPFATPLEKFTIVDLVRMTLGVGPCQFILDLEGQKRNSRGVATCYARDVINAIYKEGSQMRQGPTIEQHLDLCVAFIRNVRERIDQYAQFGTEMTAYFEEQKRLHPRETEFLDDCLSLTRKLGRLVEENRDKIQTPAFAQQQAEAFRASLLHYSEPDAFKKCETQMAVFTSIGGAQDGLVASCRMIVKVLRQRAGLALAVNPDLKEVANRIRERTQTILRNPTAYEAPRH